MGEFALARAARDADRPLRIADLVSGAVEMIGDFPRHAAVVAVERGSPEPSGRIHVEHGGCEALFPSALQCLQKRTERPVLAVLVNQELVGIDIEIPPVPAIALEESLAPFTPPAGIAIPHRRTPKVHIGLRKQIVPRPVRRYVVDADEAGNAEPSVVRQKRRHQLAIVMRIEHDGNVAFAERPLAALGQA